MPQFDGPFGITDINCKKSTVTLNLPTLSKIYPTFHTSEVFKHSENDGESFPGRKLAKPGAVITEDGQQEYFVEKIINA